MAMDEASAQLHLETEKAVQEALRSRRPLLHHLNADTSWFLQIPRPDSAIRNGSRIYFNILIDPWLAGGQSDVASWFSQQFHVEPSAVPTIAALEEFAKEMEILAPRLQQNRHGRPTSWDHNDVKESLIDAVAISHEFSDHCHQSTLLEINPDVPVFAIKEAAKLISSWDHFRTIITVDSFGADGHTDWRNTSMPPLPEWIGISRLLQTDDVLNYHSALMIVFNNHRSGAQIKHTNGTRSSMARRSVSIDIDQAEEVAEAIVYTPHGIHSGDLNLIPAASPPVHTLAFLHGLHNVRVGTFSGRTALQSNLGAHNGLRAQRILNAKYWIGTHDEIKTGRGLVSWFLQRDVMSLQDALEEERRARKNVQDSEVVKAFDEVNWMELSNGESRVLV